MRQLFFFAALSVVLLSGCQRSAHEEPIALRDDLAGYHLAVQTRSPEAQRYFDQGLVLYYGFNHEAAIASFARASELDSLCAMAWWGQAISAGPNINNPFMDSAASYHAWLAVRNAGRLSPSASPVERRLIAALTARYRWPQPDDRKALDIAYADSMRTVWKEFPDHVDVGVLFADALMNLRPWDLWSASGDPRPETPELVSTLESVLGRSPNHPGACHFYVHTMEASPWPERALAAADSLRDRIPGAGHLVHMPAHIDIRVGAYDRAVNANLKAIAADSSWIRQGGFYAVYRAHNYHFLAYAAMFDGRRKLAMDAARDMVSSIPMDLVREYADYLDAFLAVPIHVMVRFGMWEEILREPRPATDLVATLAFWRYGRTVALAALDRADEAAREMDSLRTAYAEVPESRLIGNNAARVVLEVGLPMAEGELEYRRGNYDKAFELLRLAVQRDDSLHYDEPWGWMMPVRHSLGALLLEQGRIEEAEKVYQEDLRLHPSNGWALKGLVECYERTGRFTQAWETGALFDTSWSRSDILIRASCFCRKS